MQLTSHQNQSQQLSKMLLKLGFILLGIPKKEP